MSLNGYGNRGDGMEQTKKVVSVYRELLQEYLRSKDEKVLYQAEQFSRQSIQDGVETRRNY